MCIPILAKFKWQKNCLLYVLPWLNSYIYIIYCPIADSSKQIHCTCTSTLKPTTTLIKLRLGKYDLLSLSHKTEPGYWHHCCGLYCSDLKWLAAWKTRGPWALTLCWYYNLILVQTGSSYLKSLLTKSPMPAM